MTVVVPCMFPVGAAIHVEHVPDSGTVGLTVVFPNLPGQKRPPVHTDDDGTFHLGQVTLDQDGVINLGIAITGGGLKVPS